MNTNELISDLRALGPGQDSPQVLLYTRLLLRYLADHARDAKLSSGEYLCDVTDFITWLRELADATRPVGVDIEVLPATALARVDRSGSPLPPQRSARPEQPRWTGDFCPDCGHIHIDDAECGFPIGGGRICRCERKRP